MPLMLFGHILRPIDSALISRNGGIWVEFSFGMCALCPFLRTHGNAHFFPFSPIFKAYKWVAQLPKNAAVLVRRPVVQY